MAALSPRARVLLEAVEREAADRLDELGHAAPHDAPDGLRHTPPGPTPRDGGAGPELLAALELGIAGLSRSDVADRLRAEHRVTDPEPFLDAVFGTGSSPHVRLRRGR
jgi:hypothetical protein